MPNNPAKNINSLASHTMTPTLTMFGRLSVWMRELIAGGPGRPVAVVTTRLWTAGRPAVRAGLRKSACVSVWFHICPGQGAKRSSTDCKNWVSTARRRRPTLTDDRRRRYLYHREDELPRRVGVQPSPGCPRADHDRDRPAARSRRRADRLSRVFLHLGRVGGHRGPGGGRGRVGRGGAADRRDWDIQPDPPGGHGHPAYRADRAARC